MKNRLVTRYGLFVLSLFIIAYGTSLSIRANMGSAPISAPPYVLSEIHNAPLSMGSYTILMHVLFVLLQWILLGKEFKKIQVFQILAGIVFGLFIDLTMFMTSSLQVSSQLEPANILIRCAELIIGSVILAFGICLEVKCDVIMLAGEGLQVAISKVLHKQFDKVKIAVDSLLVLLSVVISFWAFGCWRWDMIGIGTLFSMVFVGYIVGLIDRYLAKTNKFFDKQNKE